jgi:hypothetical protein
LAVVWTIIAAAGLWWLTPLWSFLVGCPFIALLALRLAAEQISATRV